ncbi:hypothetical protein LCGC14_1291630 [marine sediment metagenome]|uniref:Uncharacterized protein n=1 Tax=marine sediment metagenome TaxID=412755 RepID=A0A0F9KSD2_9ZZZZ
MSTTPIRRWRPPVVTDFPDWADERKRKSFIKELDFALRAIFDNTATIESNYIGKTPTLEGKLVNWGTASITGSGTVATGLTTIESVSLTIRGSAASDNALTYTVSGGTLTIYVWMPTAAGDTTPIAETAALTIAWEARGA